MAETGWQPPNHGHSVTILRHEDAAVIEIRLDANPAPTFTVAALDALADFVDAFQAAATSAGPTYRYVHLTSARPDLFSMGGDLQTIAALARTRDLAHARVYGHKAARIIHALWSSFDLPIVTTACATGKVFGAGFEAALACNRLVAHQGATFSFPEQRLGLYPGMGATSFLGRRLGRAAMERSLFSARVFTAAAGHDAGLIDQVTTSDVAETELRAAAEGGESRWARLMELAQMRRRHEAFSLDEALATTTIWAENVVSLSVDHLAALERVASVQKGRSRAVAS